MHEITGLLRMEYASPRKYLFAYGTFFDTTLGKGSDNGRYFPTAPVDMPSRLTSTLTFDRVKC